MPAEIIDLAERKAKASIARSRFNCKLDLRHLADELSAVIMQKSDSDPDFFGKVVHNKTKDFNYRLSDGTIAEFIVYVRKDLSSEAKNFTAAHELSHIIRHADLIRKYGSMPRHLGHFNALEKQANETAARILMPRKNLIDKTRSRKRAWNVYELARVFDVSASAMARRLSELGFSHNDLNIEPVPAFLLNGVLKRYHNRRTG